MRVTGCGYPQAHSFTSISEFTVPLHLERKLTREDHISSMYIFQKNAFKYFYVENCKMLVSKSMKHSQGSWAKTTITTTDKQLVSNLYIPKQCACPFF